ncbi:MAG: DUF1638 domain-containing protein [Deltaproteobacteria bacterium]|nr:DUF1638 domain-containing protein [Deltaproteobacteria bacterium]
MSVLGIVTCEILELEFAHLLNHDPELSRVTVLDDSQSERLIEALESNGIQNLKRISRVNEFTQDSKGQFEVLVCVLELGLHSRKQSLQEGLRKAVLALSPHVDALLLGYGLCGNALEKPDELLSDAGVPIFIPMDEDHHWRRMFDKEFGNISVDMARRLFEHYERSLLIPTPVMSKEEMRKNVEEFNSLFGFRCEEREGTMEILNKTWKEAKEFLDLKQNGKSKR